MQRTKQLAGFLAAGILAALMTGCGQPGLPLPPSLNLPMPVTDLTAQRTGDTVLLRWTMPSETTDKQTLKHPVQVEIWEQSIALTTPPANSAAAPRLMEMRPYLPNTPAEYSATLAAHGGREVVAYTVRLRNSAGRSAGGSNTAYVSGGAAVPPPENVVINNTPNGVRLSWTPVLIKNAMGDAMGDAMDESVRVHRVLITPPAQKPKSGEMVTDTYLSTSDSGAALDTSALINAEYSYSLQRVMHSVYDAVRLDSFSVATAPITVSTHDTFAPAAPTGVAAVPATNHSVDLSWNPNTERDLAGYFVYRTAENAAAVKLTGAAISVPAYRDTLDGVPHGTHVCWTVVAVDTSGNQSQPSVPDCLTLP